MKIKIISTSLMLLLLFSAQIMSFAFTNDHFVGTWSYEAEQTAPEYSKGKFIFTETEGELQGVAKIGEQSIDLVNVESKGNELNFGTYIEGEYISINLKFDGNNFTGTASFSGGTVPLKGEKERMEG